MLRSILISLCFLFLGQLQAQNSHIFLEQGAVFAHKVYGDYAYFMVGGNNAYSSNLYRMKLPDGKLEMLDSAIMHCQSVLCADSGVFYVSFAYDANGNDGKHTLNFMPAGSIQKRVLKVINQYVQHPGRTMPAMPRLISGKYYISAWFNSKNCIWESDGSLGGTSVVFQNEQSIKDYTLYQGKPLAILNNGSKDYILNSQYKMLSPDYTPDFRSPLRFFYSSDAVCIYAYKNKLYRCGEVDRVDSASLNFPGFRSFRVISGSDSVIHGYNYVGNNLFTYALRIQAPCSYDSIPPSASVMAMGNPRINVVNSRFMSLWSFKTGFEMAFAPFNDSMLLIKDLNPGYASSVMEITYLNQLLEVDGVAYFGANNGSDGKGYLYSSNGRTLKSHFPWGYAVGSISGLFIKDSIYYWTRRNGDSTFISWRSLNDRDTQPLPDQKPAQVYAGGEWHRAVAPVPGYAPYVFNTDAIQSHKVLGGNDGSITVCGLARNCNSQFYQRFSDTGIALPFKGDLSVVQYDSAGRLRWNKTFGDMNSFASLDPAFTSDRQGDILVFGKFSQEAQFDSLTLKTDRSAFFICKLDGISGDFKWVKMFHKAYYSNDISSDGIVCDLYGNIYLSFLFEDFYAEFGGKIIRSDRSPANGLVKLDPDGNVLWIKGNETPWTDKYGTSRDFIYDSTNNTLYNLISQGYYNWSASCRYAPFRSILYSISVDGDIHEMAAFEGDDLNAAICATANGKGSVFVNGFYRSQMNAGIYAVSSRHDKTYGCNINEHFFSTVHGANGRVLSLQSSSNDAFFPFDACRDGQYIYVLGAEKNPLSKKDYILSIRRYTLLGRLTARRLFQNTFTGNPFDFRHYFNLGVSGRHFLLSMSSNSRIAPFSNFVEIHEGLSVYRLLIDKDWTESTVYSETQPESGIVVAPNPAMDHITIQFSDSETYQKLDIYDALGRPVKTVHFNGEIYNYIPLGDLASGVYTLYFSGVKTHTEKLIIR